MFLNAVMLLYLFIYGFVGYGAQVSVPRGGKMVRLG